MGLSHLLNKQLRLAKEEDTEALGARLVKAQRHGLIYLEGELGAGKTTVVRGALRQLGYSGKVKSPTYTLVEPYSLAELQVFHLDLYRIKHPEELVYVGLDDILEHSDLMFVEWANHGRAVLPTPDLILNIENDPPGRMAVLRDGHV